MVVVVVVVVVVAVDVAVVTVGDIFPVCFLPVRSCYEEVGVGVGVEVTGFISQRGRIRR